MAKLLTVEDEIAIRELLAFICETDGHEVVKAASLAEAREALRRGGLDLILLDVMLPDGSGFDFLREVRTDAASASVPVVMITARGDEADWTQAPTTTSSSPSCPGSSPPASARSFAARAPRAGRASPQCLPPTTARRRSSAAVRSS